MLRRFVFFTLRLRSGRMKVGMTSSRYGLYRLGYIFATMGMPELGKIYLSPENNSPLGSDRSLQFESVKEESPVIANKPSCGEQVMEFCTNRPSRSGRGLASSLPNSSAW